MENIVKIHYSGKDYIGQIVSIESEWDCLRMIGKPDIERTLLYYKVSMYEKDTGCLIDNIFIRSIEEIKQYEDGANGWYFKVGRTGKLTIDKCVLLWYNNIVRVRDLHNILIW